MKTLSSFISEKLIISKEYKRNKIIPKTTEELISIVNERTAYDNEEFMNTYYLDMTDVDVSQLDSLYKVFNGTTIARKCALQRAKVIDISGWNTENVNSMTSLFYGCRDLNKIIGIENLNTKKIEIS